MLSCCTARPLHNSRCRTSTTTRKHFHLLALHCGHLVIISVYSDLQDSTKVKRFIPFSDGRRDCVGQALVRYYAAMECPESAGESRHVDLPPALQILQPTGSRCSQLPRCIIIKLHLQAKMNYTSVLASLLGRFHFELAPEVRRTLGTPSIPLARAPMPSWLPRSARAFRAARALPSKCSRREKYDFLGI